MRSYLMVSIAVFACLVLASACSKASDESTADKPKEGLEVGNTFLNYDSFSAKTIDGDELKLADFKGKLLFIDFWATWCPPCTTELPYLKVVQDTYVGDTFAILGISLDMKISDLRTMTKELGLEYLQICDEKGWQSAYAAAFNIRSVPTNFLIDQNGVIIAKNMRGLAAEGHVAKALGHDGPLVHYVDAIALLEDEENADPEKALALLDQAIEGDPDRPEYHFLAALIQARTGSKGKAIEHFAAGLEHKDKLPEFQPALMAYGTMSDLLKRQGETEKAIAVLDELVAAIGDLDETQKERYARFLPKIEQLKAQWAAEAGPADAG